VTQDFATLAAVEHFHTLTFALAVGEVDYPGRQHDGALLIDIDTRVVKPVCSTLQAAHDLEPRTLCGRIGREGWRYRQHPQSGENRAGPTSKRLACDRHIRVVRHPGRPD